MAHGGVFIHGTSVPRSTIAIDSIDDDAAVRVRIEPRHLWPLTLVAVATALVILVSTDVRRRGRIEPAPTVSNAVSIGVDDGASMSHRDGAGRNFPFGIAERGHRTDLTAYTAAARVLHDGGSAADAYAARSPRGWRYQYPPLLASLLQPLSTLATTTQALVFGLICSAFALLMLDESRRWWRLLAAPGDAPPIPMPAYIAIGAIAAVTLPALNSLQRGQVGLLVIWPLMAGFRLLWTSRRAWPAIAGGVLMSFPAVMKLLPALPAAFALLMAIAAALVGASRGRALASARSVAASEAPGGGAAPRRAANAFVGLLLGAALFAFVVPAALIGPSRTIDASGIFWRQVMTNPSFSTDWEFEIHANRNQSLDSAAWKLVRSLSGGERVAADPLGREKGAHAEAPRPRWFDFASTACRGALGLGALVVSLRLARHGIRGAFAGFGVAALATLVISPVSWGHHFSMLLPAMLAVPAFLESRGRSLASFTFSIGIGAAVLLHYASIDALGAIGLLGLACGAAVALLVPILWRVGPAWRGAAHRVVSAAPESGASAASPTARNARSTP